MSQITYANPTAAPPDLAVLPAGPVTPQLRSGRGFLAVPALISLSVQLVFFLAYWIPETSTVPARSWWLTQLSPLASAAITSAGQAQVSSQEVQSGIPGLLLLLFGLALWQLARTRHWLARFATVVPLLGGLLVSLGIWVACAVSSQVSCPGLTTVLMVAWLAAAGFGSYRNLVTPGPDLKPRTRRSGLAVLAAYALIGPIPTAVGRCLFGADLRDAAAGLQSNTVTGRLAGLATGATVGLYVCGVLVGVIVWLAYRCWPLTRSRAWAGRALTLVIVLLLTGLVSWPTMTAAARRTTTLTYASPAAEMGFSCGSRVLTPVDASRRVRPVETAVVTGLGCRTVSFFSGYRQVSTHTLQVGLPPKRALVSGQFGSTLVLVQSTRLDGRPTQLTALQTPAGTVQWQYRCPSRTSMRIAFDEAASSMSVECGATGLIFDPRSGPRR